jgi:hypothetical protein
MGLDITAASHLRFAKPIPRDKAFDRLEEELAKKKKFVNEVYFVLYANQACFRQRLVGMRPGLYEYTRSSRRHSFRAGSYSGYNWWRDQLCRFALGVPAADMWATPQRYRKQPFVELINFTDCDGRIGTQVSAKLSADFTSHASKARKFTPADDEMGEEGAAAYWLEVYQEFTTAFRLAAKNGALRFC